VTDEVFRTSRLRAVRWRDDHAPTAYAAYSQPEFVRYLGNPTPHPDIDTTRRWIARISELLGESPAGFWAVERLDDGELVGATLCQPLPGGDGEHEIGWHVFPRHQRNGYATEIGRGAAAYGFEVLRLEEVLAVVIPDNVASLAVARAVGMRHVGRTDRYYGVEAELFAMNR
jgi:RimJ/RimL family protein N-acetyltransferase